MDRHEWPNRFTAKDAAKAPWSCPSCGQPALTVAPGTVHVEEGRESAAARDHEFWEPEWVEGRFVCLLRCTCHEVIAVAGRQGLAQGFSGSPDDPDIDYYNYYEPLVFEPPLRPIHLATAVPSDVREQLEQSFRLFWCDLDACSNRIRTSIEKLLDYHGVKRTVISKNRKRVELKLHARIELFAKGGEPLSDHLMAVKWLGNAGSHAAAPVTRDDVFDAYEIIEFVLREMFDQAASRIKRITKLINKTKKPRSASQKWRNVKRKK